MKNSGWQAAWQHWLSFSAFTLAGVAFEGARFGSVVSPETTLAAPAKWRKADAVSPQGHAGAQR